MDRSKHGLAAVCLMLLLEFASARADDAVPKLEIVSADSSKVNRLTVRGKYTLPAKWKLTKVTVHVLPPGQAPGEAHVKEASVDKVKLTFSGTPVDVPAGSYDLEVVAVFTDHNSKTRTFFVRKEVQTVKGK